MDQAPKTSEQEIKPLRSLMPSFLSSKFKTLAYRTSTGLDKFVNVTHTAWRTYFGAIPVKRLEWLGSMSGILGSLLVASNTSWSAYGYVAYLISTIAWIGYALATPSKSIFVMQLAFLGTTALGIVRWIF